MRTYGKVTYEQALRRWVIQCEPHVSTRLKRHFKQLAKSQGEHALSDTRTNARELEWFLTRYPMEVTPAEYLQSRAAEQVDAETLVQQLLDGTAPARAFELAVPPRDYQRVAAQIALAMGGLLLADDVGLGKTVSAITMLTDPRTRPALVCTLTHLPSQWLREFKKFAPGLNVHVIKKATPYDWTPKPRRRRKGDAEQLDMNLEGSTPDVFLITYSKLSGWAETLAPIVKSAVWDEGQELRNNESKRYAAAMHIADSVDVRLALTATPIYNYGDEMHNLLRCTTPDSIPSEDEFKAEWCAADGKRISDPIAFGGYAREAGIVLRRTRRDVGRELPPITKIPHYIEADPAAIAAVSSSCAELARTILSQEAEAFKGQRMMAAEELSNKLRQATGIAKAPYVADFIRLLVESGEPVVVSAWHREVYSILLDKLADLKPAMYTGSESPTKKEAEKNRFVSGDTDVLLLSLRSGAGLDGLQYRCRTGIIAEPDWSPGVHEQNIGRYARDGQKDPVTVYFLLSEYGSDPIVADVLGIKAAQSDGILNPDGELVEDLQIDPDHMKRLAAGYLAQIGEHHAPKPKN